MITRTGKKIHIRIKCPKCDGKTHIQRIKTSHNTFRQILVCSVCRFYQLYDTKKEST